VAGLAQLNPSGLQKKHFFGICMGFPVINVGRKEIVLVDGFYKWLESNMGNTVALKVKS